MISRRDILRTACAGAVASTLPGLAFANADTDARFVLVILRGEEAHVTPESGGARAFGPADFPEIEFDKIDQARGMNVTVVTTAKTDEEGRELLRLFGMPFRN